MSAIFRRLVGDRKITKASLGKHAVNLREEADYALTFSAESAERVVRDAKGFAQAARRTLNRRPSGPRRGKGD